MDFDSQDILTALDDGVAIGVKSLLAGETGDSLIVEATETADVDVENLAATDSEGGVAYADGAIKVTGDGSVTLDIRVEADGIESIADWAEDHLSAFTLDAAGLYEAIVVEPDANRIGVAIRLYDGKLVHFRFNRADEEDLPREYALQIAGSTSEDWLDDEDDDGDEDVDVDDDFFPEIDDVFGDD